MFLFSSFFTKKVEKCEKNKNFATDCADVPKLSGAAKRYYRTYKKLFDEFSARNADNNASENAHLSTLFENNSQKMSITSMNQGNMQVSDRRYSLDIENEDVLWYNEINIDSSEKTRLHSEALTWMANKRNSILTTTSSNEATYKYWIDDKAEIHVLDRIESGDLSEKGEFYDKFDRTEIDWNAEIAGNRQGNNISNKHFGEDGRKSKNYDGRDDKALREIRNSNRTTNSNDRSKADRKKKALTLMMLE